MHRHENRKIERSLEKANIEQTGGEQLGQFLQDELLKKLEKNEEEKEHGVEYEVPTELNGKKVVFTLKYIGNLDTWDEENDKPRDFTLVAERFTVDGKTYPIK